MLAAECAAVAGGCAGVGAAGAVAKVELTGGIHSHCWDGHPLSNRESRSGKPDR